MLGFRLGSLPIFSYHTISKPPSALQVIPTLHWRLVFLSDGGQVSISRRGWR
jgi:hypothetical protein